MGDCDATLPSARAEEHRGCWHETLANAAAQHEWPMELRAALGVVADSPRGMCLLWGPQWKVFCNDAFPVDKAERERLLAQSARELWPRTELVLPYSYAALMERGDPLVLARQCLCREGRGDCAACNMSLSCSPVRLPDGRVAGVLVVVDELAVDGRAGATHEAALEHLQHVSRVFVRDGRSGDVLTVVLDAAIAITGADFGSIQVADARTGQLRIEAQRGFTEDWLAYWNRFPSGHGACAEAMAMRRTTIVEDVTTSPLFENGEARAVELRAGVRAVQSTPLISWRGDALGVISTHYRAPKRPSTQALRTLQLLARHAADVLDRQRSDEALRRSQALTTAMLSHFPEALITLDHSGRIVDWKGRAAAVFGYESDEVIGRPAAQLFPADATPAELAGVARPTGGAPEQAGWQHSRGLRRAGEQFPCLLNITRFDLAEGCFRALTVRDVTAETRLQLEQRLLADLGGSMTALDYEHALRDVLRLLTEWLCEFAVVFSSQDGVLTQSAAASRRADLAWTAEHMMELPAKVSSKHPVVSAVAAGKAVLTELDPSDYARYAEGAEHLRALHAARPRFALVTPLLAGGECVGVIGMANAGESFARRDLDLAAQIASRLAPFVEGARLLAQERRATRLRDEMMAVVAHDLRNPLNSIVLQAKLLRRRGGQPERRTTRPLEAIHASVLRMDRIVHDLLDVTRIESGKLKLDPRCLSVDAVMNEVDAAHRDQVEARGLALHMRVEPAQATVFADEMRLAQVFDNLLGNALKFTTSGEICVGARLADHQVVFSVRDTGRGIDAASLPHVFDRFWQERSVEREGTGLGLAIARGFVEALGGRMWVESELGVGSTFYFALPTSPERAAAASDGTATP